MSPAALGQLTDADLRLETDLGRPSNPWRRSRRREYVEAGVELRSMVTEPAGCWVGEVLGEGSIL